MKYLQPNKSGGQFNISHIQYVSLKKKVVLGYIQQKFHVRDSIIIRQIGFA